MLSNATAVPSPLIAGLNELSLDLTPLTPSSRLTSVVEPPDTLRTWMSNVVSASPSRRFPAADSKAITLPSSLIDGSSESPLPTAPAAPSARLTSVCVVPDMSRT